ncbi:MAG: glycerol-3-phosphate 1-O-acyltransferase PlsY [Acidobacteria bacterium]|nr:glycerol-3-phosphate 1-O-acyltransferase PlsY [Acidobacteriota bacterium]MBV9479606.1 glycerol-3-phosphate 1-O-acyltransferase PlsY [Acidobacteriota bacterium]
MILLTIALSYLLGSIPFGYLLVRTFRGSDIRQSGSGNIGATNVARTSPGLGAVTLVLDALKGFAAVMIARYRIAPHTPISPIAICAAAALLATAGHIFPLWLKFRGGKGVATALGSLIMLAPKAILVMVGLFAAIVLAFRYVSLGSILVIAMFPLLAWLLDGYGHAPVVLACFTLISVLIIGRHHQNIRRLLSGTENRLEMRRG